MSSLLKSTALGLGLLAGVAATAGAQSVSSLPPAGGATAPTAPPAVTSSTQSVLPNPGGQTLFEEGHYQVPADWDSNKNYHPYSTSIGPKPGSHSSGQDEHYQATEEDNTPARRPYTSTGTGPRPN
jgi:hypothetical protein